MASFGTKPSLRQMSRLGRANPGKAPGSSRQRNNNNPGKDGVNNGGMGAGLRKLGSEFSTKFISEAGTKTLNKDYFGFVEMDGFACWAVAETYDNDLDVISARLAVDTVLDMFTTKPTLSKRKLKSYIKEAHRQLKEQSGKFQLKASILIVATNYKKMRYAHCGNCRLYLFRGDNIFLKSHDQTLQQEMINEGQIPDDGIRGLDESRNLLNYLGKQSAIKVEASKKIVLYDEDILLLTTWGFWEKINTLEMLDALEDAEDPLGFLDDLQDLYLSKQERHVNNYTLAAVFANKTFKEKNNTRKIIKIILLVSIPLLIAGIIAFIYLYRANAKRMALVNSVLRYESQGDMYIEDVNYDRALSEYGSGVKESAGLKETTGKKGVENETIKTALTTKQRVAQLVVDGDDLFEKGKYEEAGLSYQKALKEAKYDLDLFEMMETKEIDAKITLCDDYAYTDELIALADFQASLDQNDQAMANYEEARRLAIRNRNKTAEQDIKLKMETLQSRIKAEEAAQTAQEEQQEQAEQNERLTAIDKDVLSGDAAVIGGEFVSAVNIYTKAYNDFLVLGEVDKASTVSHKILEATEKIKQQDDESQGEIAAGYARIGDRYMLENDYDAALENYQAARDIYSNIKYSAEVTEINEKIDGVKAKQNEYDVAMKLIEISLIESEGDQLLQAKNYAGAKEQYRQAQILAQGINQMDKVLTLQDKIKGVEDIEAEIKNEAAASEKEKMVYQAQTYELFAEDALRYRDYQSAYNNYSKAKELYQNAGEYEKALLVQERLIEIEKRLY